ncbi:peptidoglycan-binding protein [Streptomyces sp. HNM0663]|uniref:Peptidoglycan-binding protein n=1 Tax=Streptomyces chengmaiensis TaxID=3040919 RepID=A0ABT6HQA6_9ACTN|nr:peptidoglycan-binding protein [Streptomyces chengmaiensis]MDH2390511.1 peptidoglycan-binding protein [Streptomyces chengmaiensis]
MTVPVFQEYEPAADCDCPGCAERRRTLAAGGHPAAHGCRRALVVVTAAGVVLGGAGGGGAAAVGLPTGPDRVAEPDPPSVQGGTGPLHGRPLAGPADGQADGPADGQEAEPLRPMTRAEIINRAKKWVAAKVPYSMEKYWSDGYRQDCSGYVSMAWNLPGNEWTGSLALFATKISREDLQPGDILLFHNPLNPTIGSHVTIFGGWTDYTHDYYVAYEQTPPHTRKQATPMAYWTNSDSYVAYRYKGLTSDTSTSGSGTGDTSTSTGGSGSGTGTGGAGTGDTSSTGGSGSGTGDTSTSTSTSTGGSGSGTGTGDTSSTGGTGTGTGGSESTVDVFPGAEFFGPGADNAHLTRLGEMLVERGGGHFYSVGPGPRWSEADRRATEAFQLAQGWRGADADGIPGPETWRRLVTGDGHDIPAARSGGAGGTAAEPPAFPGRAHFRPGRSNAHVARLGQQLVARGYGTHYRSGPGPRWTEADRRNVAAFQRAQGWRGAAADGYPGPETWRRLFN